MISFYIYFPIVKTLFRLFIFFCYFILILFSAICCAVAFYLFWPICNRVRRDDNDDDGIEKKWGGNLCNRMRVVWVWPRSRISRNVIRSLCWWCPVDFSLQPGNICRLTAVEISMSRPSSSVGSLVWWNGARHFCYGDGSLSFNLKKNRKEIGKDTWSLKSNQLDAKSESKRKSLTVSIHGL